MKVVGRKGMSCALAALGLLMASLAVVSPKVILVGFRAEENVGCSKEQTIRLAVTSRGPTGQSMLVQRCHHSCRQQPPAVPSDKFFVNRMAFTGITPEG